MPSDWQDLLREAPVLPPQSCQASRFARLQARRVLQQRVARPLERLARRLPEAVLLAGADLVDGVGGQPLDLNPVVDHPRLRHPRCDRLAVTRRQVSRHQFDPGAAGRSS